MDLPSRTLPDLRRILRVTCNREAKVKPLMRDLISAIQVCQRGKKIEVVKPRPAPLIPEAARRRLLNILAGLDWDVYVAKGGAVTRTLARESGGSLVLGATKGVPSSRGFDNIRGNKAFNLTIVTNRARRDERDLLELWYILKELVRGVDPTYHFSSVQINKNFAGTPHIDRNNVNYQYAMSLGDFKGGDLVVSTDDPYLYVQHETHNRLAKTDSRHPHWVKRHTGGDRYSLIMYDITGRQRPRLSNIPASRRG